VTVAPDFSPLWRRALLRAVIVPVPVLAPLIAMAPTADHRFNIYWYGSLFRDDPLRMVPQTLDSLPGYLRAGNFRPLGRILEKSADLAAYTLGDALGLPANVAFRAISIVAAMLLGVAAVLLAECVVARGPLFRRPPSTLTAVVPFAVGAGLVAAGRSSPVVLFGSLYLTSGALVLAVAAVLCRAGADRRLRGWWYAPLVAAGMTLALVNEIVYLALPLATVAVLARGRFVSGRSWRRLVTTTPARMLGLLWLGFLPVFAGIRAVIAWYCSTGPCYHGSDVQLGGPVLPAVPVRAVAWFPPLMWSAAHGRWSAGVVPAVALLVLAAVAGQTLRELPRLAEPGRGGAWALIVVAGALVLLGATLGALNLDVQQIVAAHRWGQGWRDSSVTMPAGALLIAALVHLRPGRRPVLIVAIVLLTGAATASATANKRFRDTVMSTEAARLDDRLAQAMADFDPTPAGAARRCALRAEFFTLFAAAPFSQRRFDQAFTSAAEQRAGVPFCAISPPGRPGVTGRQRGR
jgi:hypothetical protein